MAKPTPRPDADDWPERPDRWAEADKAWDTKWSDRPPPEEDVDGHAESSDVYRAASSARSGAPASESVTEGYGDGMRAAGPYLGLGLQIGGSMVLFVGAGRLVDRWLETSPWGVVLGAALGMVGVLVLVVRVAREADARQGRAPD